MAIIGLLMVYAVPKLACLLELMKKYLKNASTKSMKIFIGGLQNIVIVLAHAKGGPCSPLFTQIFRNKLGLSCVVRPVYLRYI